MNSGTATNTRKETMNYIILICVFLVVLANLESVSGMSPAEKREMKDTVLEMFRHAYDSYMTHARPADELMPLSCKGRYRGTEPSRGDIDESLGNFTLTLIDTLDTLVILNEVEEFEIAVRHVIEETSFDSDIVVSVFETNIRVLGGLLSGHILALHLKKIKRAMGWYNDELLTMAKDIGYRLLPAFNTSTGIPFPRVNLRNGVETELASRNRDTCTACAGTMILEFAALSRLTGHTIFEEKAHKAMDYLWKQRHRTSDLVGTVINVHNGDWIRRESGVGAGIDSYYEYVLKAYILLGDDTYLERFNTHYDAVMKYVSQGPMLMDVHMHKPQSTSKHFMDALLAFWPGLQVLKGDIKPAIETHEMLYQVVQKHNFLPEAFTTDFRVHWGQHPLRPEFVESTYFLYKATSDPYYLEVGKVIVEKLNQHARVPCGFAAIKDVTLGTHEDQMDSFVLAETFKYLYLLFSEKSDILIDVDDYIFTTEAHLLPLSLSMYNSSRTFNKRKLRREMYNNLGQEELLHKQQYPQEIHLSDRIQTSLMEVQMDQETCPNPQNMNHGLTNYAHKLRLALKNLVQKENTGPSRKDRKRLLASEFISGNADQLSLLAQMGIRIVTMSDGRIQLLHTASEAVSPEYAADGMKFMQEMIELSKTQQTEGQHDPVSVQLISPPFHGSVLLKAGPAQFGYSLKTHSAVQGKLFMSNPFSACTNIEDRFNMVGKIAVLQRGDCMFVDKARNIQNAGAIGGIVIDNSEGSSVENQPLFAMSGDGKQDVDIPMVFLFHKEGATLLTAMANNRNIEVILAHMEKEEAPSQGSKPVEPVVDTKQQGESAGQPIDSSNSKSASDPKHTQFMQLSPIDSGSFKFQMEVEVVPDIPEVKSSPQEDIIQLVQNPDGSKQMSIRFDKLTVNAANGKVKIDDIYASLVQVLQQRTNFAQLTNQADYLLAISKFLQATYMGATTLDNHSQNLIHQLGNELELIDTTEINMESDSLNNIGPNAGRVKDSPNGPNSEKILTDSDTRQDTHSTMPTVSSPMEHYSTEKELSDSGNPQVDPPAASIQETSARIENTQDQDDESVLEETVERHLEYNSGSPERTSEEHNEMETASSDVNLDKRQFVSQNSETGSQKQSDIDSLEKQADSQVHTSNSAPVKSNSQSSQPTSTKPVRSSNETKIEKTEL